MEDFELGYSEECNFLRDKYGTGWVGVKEILDYVTEFALCVAGLSGWYWRNHVLDGKDGGDIRRGRDGFNSIMIGEALFMTNAPVMFTVWRHSLSLEDELVRPSTDPRFPLRHTPLCCSLWMRCAQEFEETCRPSQALKCYVAARKFSSQDSDMEDITSHANSAIERLMAAETDSGSRTWEDVSPACVFGPFYRKDENNGWVTEFGYYLMDGRTRAEEITFSLCDFMEKKSGGDREKYLQELCALPAVVKDFPTGTPLHCSIYLHCAQEWKKMGRLDEAVVFLCCVRKIAASDRETSLTKKESCDELAMIFSGELHIDTNSGEVHTIDVSDYRQRFMELVDYSSLKEIGDHFWEAGNHDEAIECYAHCLVKKASCHSGYASTYLWLLSRVYEELGELQATLILVEQARLGSELEKCQCTEPPIGSAVAPAQYGDDFSRRIRCPRHHLMPMISMHQGRLQSQYGSKEEAKETFEKGLQLAGECGDAELITAFQEELSRILAWQLSDFMHMSGNFSMSIDDHKMAMKHSFQTYIEDQQKLLTGQSSACYWASEDLVLMLQDFLDIFCKRPGNPNSDEMKLKLDKDRKKLVKWQETPMDGDMIERRFRLHNLAQAHIDVMADIIWLNIRSCHQDVKHHFKEAVNCTKAAYADSLENMHTLDLRLILGYFALHNLIQDYGEAEELFRGVIKVVEKKLSQLATVNDKHALKFLEMTKHAYTGLIHTYLKRATALFFEIDEDGHEQHAFTGADMKSLLDQEDARKSLLWAERLKGRVLSKLLNAVTSSSEENASTINAHHWILEGPFSGISEHNFHNDDDWAMNFLFSDEKFVHRVNNDSIGVHFGPRIFFITYTMLSPNVISVTILMDDEIIFFGSINCSDTIDKETQKIAEEEMDLLRQGLRDHRNSDEHAASTSKTAIPPPLFAMNEPESRIRYYNNWISGLVARFQRLTYEAQSKRGNRETPSKELDEIDSLLHKLYDILIGPIAEPMRDIESTQGHCNNNYMLVFVPHEDLSVVPFPALRDENGTYLIEKHPVSVCPSMWIFRHCQHLYFKQLEIPCGPELLVGRKTGYPKGWSDLQNAHKEIKKIKEFCEQSATEVLDSGDAAERPMKERVMETAKTASWVHFAVHGEISGSFPHGSLLLGDNDMTRWNSDEITAAGLPCARSVVLSACQSGLGTLGGEGVLGFARAFVRAEVPSCVLSLWQVHDGFCLGFMEQLYKNLHEGKTLANAMRESTLFMMRETKPSRNKRNKVPEPKWLVLDWAAFSCVGYAGVSAPSDPNLPLEVHNSLAYLPSIVQHLPLPP